MYIRMCLGILPPTDALSAFSLNLFDRVTTALYASKHYVDDVAKIILWKSDK